MKTKKVKKIIAMIIGIIVIEIYAISNANNSIFKAKITSTKTELNPGDEITITLNVYDINMGDYGINTIEGTIEYDKEIFEAVKNSDIQSKNNWSTTYNDENSILNGKFLSANLTSGVKENTEIFAVTLKVNSNIKTSKNTKIIFKDITSNNGVNLVNAGTKTLDVIINGESIDDSSSETNLINTNTSLEKAKDGNKAKNIIIIAVIMLVLSTIVITFRKRKKSRK